MTPVRQMALLLGRQPRHAPKPAYTLRPARTCDPTRKSPAEAGPMHSNLARRSVVMTAAAFLVELPDRGRIGAGRRNYASKEREGEKGGSNGFHDQSPFSLLRHGMRTVQKGEKAAEALTRSLSGWRDRVAVSTGKRAAASKKTRTFPPGLKNARAPPLSRF